MIPSDYTKFNTSWRDRKEFDVHIENLKHLKVNFTRVSRGSREYILYENDIATPDLFVDIDKSENTGTHIGKFVKKDIDTYLKSKAVNPNKKFDYHEQLFNVNALKAVLSKKVKIGQPIIAIDINDCYWNTAKMLGYISHKTYIQGLKKKKYKLGRNASIGALNMKEVVTYYVDGIAKTSEVRNGDPVLSVIRNEIINHVYEVFLSLHKKIKNDFYFYLTDCVFCSYDVADKVSQHFIDSGYDVKTKSCELLDVDFKHNIVSWFDYTAKKVVTKGIDGVPGHQKYYIFNQKQVVNGK